MLTLVLLRVGWAGPKEDEHQLSRERVFEVELKLHERLGGLGRYGDMCSGRQSEVCTNSMAKFLSGARLIC